MFLVDAHLENWPVQYNWTILVGTEETSAPTNITKSLRALDLLPRGTGENTWENMDIGPCNAARSETIIWTKATNSNYSSHILIFCNNRDCFYKKKQKKILNRRSELKGDIALVAQCFGVVFSSTSLCFRWSLYSQTINYHGTVEKLAVGQMGNDQCTYIVLLKSLLRKSLLLSLLAFYTYSGHVTGLPGDTWSCIKWYDMYMYISLFTFHVSKLSDNYRPRRKSNIFRKLSVKM